MSAVGTRGALQAMRTNEGLTNSRYQAVLERPLPADVAAVVQRNREDERRHLAFIELALEQEVWKRQPDEEVRPSGA